MATLVMYGRPDCEDTDHARDYLSARKIPFSEVNIDADQNANAFVIFINGGSRLTPTLVLDDGRTKTIIAEPSDSELDRLVEKLY